MKKDSPESAFLLISILALAIGFVVAVFWLPPLIEQHTGLDSSQATNYVVLGLTALGIVIYGIYNKIKYPTVPLGRKSLRLVVNLAILSIVFVLARTLASESYWLLLLGLFILAALWDNNYFRKRKQ